MPVLLVVLVMLVLVVAVLAPVPVPAAAPAAAAGGLPTPQRHLVAVIAVVDTLYAAACG